MARALRIEFPGALYHIINRGIGQMMIFHDDKDWKRFLGYQARVMKQFNWLCHAYCLMGNHYHLLVETHDPNLSKGMKLLNQLYSQFYNFKYQRCGPVFQGRYKAWLVDKEDYYLENCRYIVNNPGKARLVQHPSEWIWSSYNATSGSTKAPPWLATDHVLLHFSSSKRKAIKMYEEFVLDGIDAESPLQEAKHKIFLGSDSYVGEVLKNVVCDDTWKIISRERKIADRPSLEELFDGNDFLPKKARNRLIKVTFEEHQYTLKEIGDHLELNPNYLSRLLCDMRKR